MKTDFPNVVYKRKHMKRVFKLILLISLLTTLLALACHGASPLLGDVNGDGMLNSNDAIHLLRHTLDKDKYPINQSGNINGDKSVDSNDAIHLLRHTLDKEKYPILSCPHSYTEYPAQEATCTQIGWNAYGVCSLCGYSTYEEIGITPHAYEDNYCKDCGNSYISSNGFHAHKNKLTPATKSTCSKNGASELLVCTDCGKTLVRSEPLPLLPHQFANGSCQLCGTAETPSQGLAFTANNEGNMVLRGIGSCTDTQIVIPSTFGGKPVVSIAQSAFAENKDIVQVVIPSSVETIDASAFERCTGLVSVTFNEGLEFIGKKAFMCCTALKSVTIPDSVTRMDAAAFIACYKLESATLGKGLTKISEDVFFECYNMKTLTLRAAVTKIGGWALFDCDSLEVINYGGTKAEWLAMELGDFMDENSGNYIVYCQENATSHKHLYSDWSETGNACELSRTCSVCSFVNLRYKHSVTNAKWILADQTASKTCQTCQKAIESYAFDFTAIALNFDTAVATELSSYPYFTLVSDKNNKRVSSDGRSAWSIGSTTYIDYDADVFDNSSILVVSFDMKVTKKGSTMRDTSVFSFVPGMNGGTKVGSTVTHAWQIKYLPLLDKLSTKALNGTDVPYKTIEDIPNIDAYNSSNTVNYPLNKWATVVSIFDLESQISYVFVDGTPIGTVSGFAHTNKSFADAFTLRFCDNANHTTLFDNFRIDSYTAN